MPELEDKDYKRMWEMLEAEVGSLISHQALSVNTRILRDYMYFITEITGYERKIANLEAKLKIIANLEAKLKIAEGS